MIAPHRCWLCHLPNEKQGLQLLIQICWVRKKVSNYITQVLKQVCSLVYGCFYNSSSHIYHRWRSGLFSFSSHYKKCFIKYSRFFLLRSEHTILISAFALQKPRKIKKTTRRCLMKSLARLLISHFYQYLCYLFPTFWTYWASFLDYLSFIPSCIEQGTEIPENPIKKIRLLNASLFYPRILSTTFNKSYGLEIPGISNNLYHF